MAWRKDRASRVQKLAVVVLVAAFAAPIGAQAQPPDGETAQTAAVGRDFVHMFFVQHNVTAALNKYAAPDLIQHNPDIENGGDGDLKFFAARRKRDPSHFQPESQWRDSVDHFLVDHDLFAVHHHVYTSATDRGRVFLDLYRVVNGRIVEHWDIIQPVPDASKNSNTMW